MYVNTEFLGGNFDMFQYVNPQDTDKKYSRRRESQLSTVSNGLMTPPQSVIDTSSCRPSLMISKAAAFCNADPGSASSTPSFDSSPGFLSSCPSSASTAPSSRRQSAVCLDNQQQYYLPAAASSTPLFRSGLPKEPWSLGQQLFQDPFSTDDQGINSSGTSFSDVRDSVISAHDDDPFAAANARITCQDRYALPYGMPAYAFPSQTLTTDLVLNFNETLTPRPIEYPHAPLESSQPTIFPNIFPQQGVMFSQTTAQTSPSALESSFEYQSGRHDQDMSCSEDESPAYISKIEDERPSYSPRIKGRRPQKTSITRGSPEKSRNDGQSVCKYCPLKEPIGKHRYACNRPEHLRRHIEALHPEFEAEHGYHKKEYPCKFADCIDKKKGRRKVIPRGDNYKTHYTKTHFSYGNTEKSGKNVRKSMKMSIEEGLRDVDARWILMLAGKMKVGEDVKSIGDGKPGQCFLSVWKMIGYSIKETREIRVKDIAPDWQGPDDTTLEKFDCRWKALKDGKLDYEQAMSVGTNMLETPKQGLLGVDMLESKEMGLVDKDPRWKQLLSGRMSIEDSEKLGVKQLALQARRKR